MKILSALTATLVVGALAGAADAAVLFKQTFQGPLSASESMAGGFAVAGGKGGHVGGAYPRYANDWYQFSVDLRDVTAAELTFDFWLDSEFLFDGFNVAAAVAGDFGSATLLNPTSGPTYDGLLGHSSSVIGGQAWSGERAGRAVFDLTSFAGRTVDLRLRFASDFIAEYDGATFDNVVVSGTTPGVPEPASWALLIGGFGLVGAALRGRSNALRSEA